MVRTKCTMAVFYGLLTARKAEKIRNHIIWEYGARETGDFLLVNSTHLERHYGEDRIKHSHTPPTMREKP